MILKTIIITGISRGIGQALAILFLRKGWRVIGTSTKGSSNIAHSNLTCFSVDLSSQTDINNFVSQVRNVDVLVNNAAVLLEKWDQQHIDFNQLKETFDVNVFVTIFLTELLIPKLSNQGQIINISSGWGSFSGNDSPFQPHYKLSKACINMYTKVLSERNPCINVSSFDPGWVKTDMGTIDAPKTPEEAAQEIFDLIGNEVKPNGCFWSGNELREW